MINCTPIKVVLKCKNGYTLEFTSTYDEYGQVSVVTFDGRVFVYSPCNWRENTATFVELDSPKQVEIDWDDPSLTGTPAWVVSIRDGTKGK